MNRIIFFVVVLLIMSIPACCSETPKIWIIAIGVSKYIQPLNPLPKASDGAQQIVDAFDKARPESTESVLLTTDSDDESLQPTKANVIRSLTQLAQNAKPGDLAVVYFCGHGVESGGQQYLLTKEADLSSSDGIVASTISLQWLRKKIDSLPCNGRLLLLDACRETLESMKVSGGVNQPAPMTRDFLSSGGTWQSQPGKASATLFGCGEGQKVYHGKDGSFFTMALVAGLSGEALDKQGQVTLQSLAGYVNKRVPESVHKEFGNSAKQIPVLKSTGVKMVFRPSPGYIACFNFPSEYGDLFADAMQTRLAASGEVYLVERTSLSAVMKEHKVQGSGLTDPDTIQKMGKLVNAKYVLVGSSKKTPDGKLHISARLVATATGQNMLGVAADSNVTLEDWEPGINALTDDLLTKMRGVTQLNRPSVVQTPYDIKTKKNPKDGADMVFIPAGEFQFGSNDHDPDEVPFRKLAIDGYWIYKYEVTVGEYKIFCQETGHNMPPAPAWGWQDNFPVVNIMYSDAEEYAKWAGGSLPTNPQWEKAVRGTDGRLYPWGNEWDKTRCNSQEQGPNQTMPVGSFPSGVSPYGCYDMAGNAGEWSGEMNGGTHQTHPGTFLHGAYEQRCSDRIHALTEDFTNSDVGFRIVLPASAQKHQVIGAPNARTWRVEFGVSIKQKNDIVYLTAPGPEGKVLKDMFLDFDRNPVLALDVPEIETEWTAVISDGVQHFSILNATSRSGKLTFDLVQISGWAGKKNIMLIIWPRTTNRGAGIYVRNIEVNYSR
jgi:formylglycine-generating enzyme required for sulfatase activity